MPENRIYGAVIEQTACPKTLEEQKNDYAQAIISMAKAYFEGQLKNASESVSWDADRAEASVIFMCNANKKPYITARISRYKKHDRDLFQVRANLKGRTIVIAEKGDDTIGFYTEGSDYERVENPNEHSDMEELMLTQTLWNAVCH